MCVRSNSGCKSRGFFFKQKTAYEVRISDWSSDVCSSDLVEVAGTISDPRAILRAERPGLGIGLVNLEARLTGAPNGYRLAATGGTDYGPLSADVVLLTAAGPLTIDVERADLSGIGMKGRLVQSEAGPVVGRLDAEIGRAHV